MTNFFKQLYTLWCAIVFVGLFLILFPFFLAIIPIKRWHKFSFYLNRIWATIALFMVGISTEIIGREKLSSDEQYVFCANHFSLMDILSFGFAPNTVIYVGKVSLAKIPLFGYMFKKIHVTVDRGSIKNRYHALQEALDKIGDDKSLVMFPEGGIYSKNLPKMVRFKDGAFRAAITKQIPLVPVSLPDNWIILPDESVPLISRKKMRMIFHEPISTEGMTFDDIPQLKEKVYQIIQEEIDEFHTVVQ